MRPRNETDPSDIIHPARSSRIDLRLLPYVYITLVSRDLDLPPTMTSRTPLRRVSQGSLFAISRSQQNPDAPHGLGFIDPVMSELVDEAEALHANLENLRRLSDSLRSFNESFASWLYVMDMNALTTDWLQVCANPRSAVEPG